MATKMPNEYSDAKQPQRDHKKMQSTLNDIEVFLCAFDFFFNCKMTTSVSLSAEVFLLCRWGSGDLYVSELRGPLSHNMSMGFFCQQFPTWELRPPMRGCIMITRMRKKNRNCFLHLLYFYSSEFP